MTREDRVVEVSFGKVFLWILFAVFIIMALVFLFGSFYMISAGERGIVLQFGNPKAIAVTEGLHFKVPIRDEVVKIDIKTQKYEADASAASKDLQTVSTKIAVNYHLNPQEVVTLYREVGLSYNERLIQPTVQEVVKASTAQFTAEELITRRSEVKDMIKQGLKERLDSRGIIVEDISITDFNFSPEFNNAIEAKVTAEQNALAEKNKVAQIEYIAKQKIAEAEGIKQSSILEAEGKAEAIRIQSEAIKAQGGKDYVQLQAINKWDGKMPQFMSSSTPMPFVDVNKISAV